jgi:hypothetical protein
VRGDQNSAEALPTDVYVCEKHTNSNWCTMPRRHTLLAVAGVLLVALSGSGLLLGTDAGDDLLDAALGAENPPPVDADAVEPGERGPYDVTVERMEECGTTCRDVTARLTNTGDRDRRDVVVETRLYALLWRGNATVGRLAVGETHDQTERVDLGYRDALAVERNDGVVTVQTIVHSATGRTVFEERRTVA